VLLGIVAAGIVTLKDRKFWIYLEYSVFCGVQTMCLMVPEFGFEGAIWRGAFEKVVCSRGSAFNSYYIMDSWCQIQVFVANHWGAERTRLS